MEEGVARERFGSEVVLEVQYESSQCAKTGPSYNAVPDSSPILYGDAFHLICVLGQLSRESCLSIWQVEVNKWCA